MSGHTHERAGDAHAPQLVHHGFPAGLDWYDLGRHLAGKRYPLTAQLVIDVAAYLGFTARVRADVPGRAYKGAVPGRPLVEFAAAADRRNVANVLFEAGVSLAPYPHMYHARKRGEVILVDEETNPLRERVEAADSTGPASIPDVDTSLPVLVAVPTHAALVRGLDHPDVQRALAGNSLVALDQAEDAARFQPMPVASVDDLARVMDDDPRARITPEFREAVSALADQWEHDGTHVHADGEEGTVPCVAVTAVVRVAWDYLAAVLPQVRADAYAQGVREATARGQAGVDEWFGAIVGGVIDAFEEADWDEPDVSEIRGAVLAAMGVTEQGAGAAHRDRAAQTVADR